MKRYGFLAACIIFACGVMWSDLTYAQSTFPKRKPDLIPVPVGGCVGADEYCNVAGENLLIVVKNQKHICNFCTGSGNAPASTTKVEYSDGVVVFLKTPPIPADGIVVLTTPVRWNKCFTITVDSTNKVKERDETNNSANGCCFCIS